MLQCTTRSNTSTPSSMIPVGRAGSASPIYVSCPSKNAHHHGQCQCVTASHLMIDSSTKKKKKEDSTRHRHTNGKPSFTFRDDIYIIFFSSTSHIILYNDRIRPQSQSRNRGTKIQKSAGRDGTHTISFALSKHQFVGSTFQLHTLYKVYLFFYGQ